MAACTGYLLTEEMAVVGIRPNYVKGCQLNISKQCLQPTREFVVSCPSPSPHIKRVGLFVKNFEQNPQENKVLLCGYGLKLYQSIKKETCIFCVKTMQDTSEAPAVDLVRLNTIRTTKTTFLTS